MRAAFFINPHSERISKKGSRLATHAPDFGAKVYDLALFEALPSQVSAALDSADLIVIEGGDGTVQCVMSEFLRQADGDNPLPDFALASGGMTNQVAKLIGMHHVGRSGLKAIFDKPERLETRMLRLRTPDSPDQFGFLFSTGALPMVTEYAKSELHSRGIGGSAAVVGGIVKAVTSERGSVMPATDCRLILTDAKMDGPHLGTIATTLSSITMGLDPFWGEEDAPVRLTYIGGEYRGLYRHVAGIWAGFKAKDRRPDGFYSWNVEQAEYSYDGPVMMDGEPLHIPAKAFTLEASRSIRIRR